LLRLIFFARGKHVTLIDRVLKDAQCCRLVPAVNHGGAICEAVCVTCSQQQVTSDDAALCSKLTP
jgi:hypothetical protein